jgi:hypothetical protein
MWKMLIDSNKGLEINTSEIKRTNMLGQPDGPPSYSFMKPIKSIVYTFPFLNGLIIKYG